MRRKVAHFTFTSRTLEKLYGPVSCRRWSGFPNSHSWALLKLNWFEICFELSEFWVAKKPLLTSHTEACLRHQSFAHMTAAYWGERRRCYPHDLPQWKMWGLKEERWNVWKGSVTGCRTWNDIRHVTTHSNIKVLSPGTSMFLDFMYYVILILLLVSNLSVSCNSPNKYSRAFHQSKNGFPAFEWPLCSDPTIYLC